MEALEVMEEMMALNAGMNLLPGILGLALYVLNALGLYAIAQRRGISSPWLAWIPFGNAWILGSIADGYQRAVKNKTTARRKVLLGLEIATAVAGIIMMIAMVGMAVDLVMEWGLDFETSMNTAESDAFALAILQFAGKTVGLGFLVSVIAIVCAVFSYMSYYDLFRSCNPDSAVLYLVLSILFSFLGSVFVFLSRNADGGMPQPQPEPQPIPEPISEQQQEPEQPEE